MNDLLEFTKKYDPSFTYLGMSINGTLVNGLYPNPDTVDGRNPAPVDM